MPLALATGPDGLRAGLEQVERLALAFYGIDDELDRSKLTTEVRHRIQLLPPLIGYGDGVLLDATVATLESNLVGVGDHGGDSVLVDGVQHVVEVISVDRLALGHLRWKILHDLDVVLEPREEILDAELIEPGDLDELDVGDLQQALLARQHLAEEILVDR